MEEDQHINNNRIEIRDAGEKTGGDKDPQTQKNKKFFKMPPTNRKYPHCNRAGGTVLDTYTDLTREFMTCASLCHELLVETKKEKDGSVTKTYQGSSPDEIAICTGAKRIGVEFMGNSLKVSKIDFLGELQDWEVLIVSFPIFYNYLTLF